MFRRMLFTLAVILVLAISASALKVETPGWTAWLYESRSGRVTRVDSDGEARQFTLPLEQGFNAYGQKVAVSPSGSHVAYIAAGTSNRQLFVYDVALDSLVASYPISPEVKFTSLDVGFGSGAAMFNEGTPHGTIAKLNSTTERSNPMTTAMLA